MSEHDHHHHPDSKPTNINVGSSFVAIPEITRAIQQYLDVEHGGGRLSRHVAEH
jgi:hypothetical protein